MLAEWKELRPASWPKCYLIAADIIRVKKTNSKAFTPMATSVSPFNRKRIVGSAVFADLTEENRIDRLTYPISTDYVKDWTAVRAMAELVSNAIDEDPSCYSVTWENGCLIIEDNGQGIGESAHMFGASDKTDDQLGTFGEGKCIANLVLARNKNIGRILFETVDYSFEPTIVRANLLTVATRKNQGKLAPELLALDFYPSDRTKGTRITIECDEVFLEKVKARFLHFRPGYVPSATRGQIMPNEAGKIYIGGVLVKDDSEFAFGYNLPLASMKKAQNRDRNVIDGYMLSNEIAKLWQETTDPTVLEKWLDGFFKNSFKQDREKMPFGRLDPTRRLLMRSLAKKVADTDKMFYLDGYGSNKDKADALKAKGYKKIIMPSRAWDARNFLSELGIKSVSELMPNKTRQYVAPKQLANGATEWVGEKKLTIDQKAIRDEAIDRVQGLFGKRAVSKVRIYERTKADISYPGSWRGFYDAPVKVIALNKSCLRSVDICFDAMLPLVAQKIAIANSKNNYYKRTTDQLFADQLLEMLEQATDQLRLASAMPTISKKAADKAANPAGAVKTLVKKQMTAKGYKSAVDMEAATAVRISILRQMQGGKTCNDQIELAAACKHLDLHWSVVFLALQSTTLASVKRNKSGWLYGQNYRLIMNAVKHLETLGAPYQKLAKIVEDQAEGRMATLKDKTDWQKVYHQLLKEQAKDL